MQVTSQCLTPAAAALPLAFLVTFTNDMLFDAQLCNKQSLRSVLMHRFSMPQMLVVLLQITSMLSYALQAYDSVGLSSLRTSFCSNTYNCKSHFGKSMDFCILMPMTAQHQTQ